MSPVEAFFVVCQSVRLSNVRPFLSGKAYSKLKIGVKETHDTGDSLLNLAVERSNACRGGGNFVAAQLVCFTGTLMSNGR